MDLSSRSPRDARHGERSTSGLAVHLGVEASEERAFLGGECELECADDDRLSVTRLMSPGTYVAGDVSVCQALTQGAGGIGAASHDSVDVRLGYRTVV